MNVVNRQFPPSFGLYTASALGRKYVLGEHQSQPLYAVSVHSGLSGQPSTVLHSGPSTDLPPLAAADAAMFGSSCTVDLPPLVVPVPGAGAAASPQTTARQERMESSGGFVHRKMSFEIEVGGGGPLRREAFEWRHSRGPEVAALGSAGGGWKLVRLGGAGPGVGAGREEVVAVWSNVRMSLTKLLQFRFLNSGLSGVLGERWAVMAVITALRMWDREMRQRRRGAAGGAAAGGDGGGV